MSIDEAGSAFRKVVNRLDPDLGASIAALELELGIDRASPPSPPNKAELSPVFFVRHDVEIDASADLIGYLFLVNGRPGRSIPHNVLRQPILGPVIPIDDKSVVLIYGEALIVLDQAGAITYEVAERSKDLEVARTLCASRRFQFHLPSIRRNLRELRSAFDRLNDACMRDHQPAAVTRFIRDLPALTFRVNETSAQTPSAAAITPSSALPDFLQIDLPPELLGRLKKLVALIKGNSTARPRGLVFHGPPGTGKTLLARILARESGSVFIGVTAGDVKSKYGGQAAKEIARLWAQARETQGPVVLFFDEAEGLFTSRSSEETSFNERDATQSMLAEWDGVRSQDDRILVVLATNSVASLDPAIMSRADEAIEMPLPSPAARRRILTKELAKHGSVILIDPRESVGFSGRDLATAARRAVQDAYPNKPLIADLRAAFERLRESSSTAVAKGGWETLVLPSHLKSRLIDMAKVWANAEAVAAQGFSVPLGALLVGAPGTGKTEIARTMAGEVGLMFIGVTASDWMGNWAGHSTTRVRETFARARAAAPSILFIDEIDTITGNRQGMNPARSEILSELLSQLDGIKRVPKIFVIAATNAPELIDSAIRSRLGEQFLIPMPDHKARLAILKLHLGTRPIENEVDIEAELDRLALATDGLSGRDLVRQIVVSIDRSAISRAIRDGHPEKVRLAMTDFGAAVEKLRYQRSTSPSNHVAEDGANSGDAEG